ncbi:MAG: alpha/beta hydrolase [Mycobacteriaceae bacterium]
MSTTELLPGFVRTRISTTDGTQIAVAHAGTGPPLLLLHGYPQSGAMWHELAPVLAQTHHVVVSDLRGYGDSDRPTTVAGANHVEHSFRAMADDQVQVMAALGHEHFAVVGHDRGARTAHRMALDHPGVVERLAVLDIVPTRHVLATVDRTVAQAYYHWFFLTQPEPLPETLIGADPVGFLRLSLSGALAGSSSVFTAEAMEEYERCFDLPGAVHSVCEDYRAAGSIDQLHDDADAHRLLTQPLLALWGTQGLVGRHYDVGAAWRQCAQDVRTASVHAGHFLVEQAPAETLAVLQDWLAPPGK